MKHNDDNFNEDQDFSFNEENKRPFDLPLDYFLSFEDKLRKKMEEEHELQDFPILSSIQKSKVFEIPGDYFTEAANSLERQVELEAYPHLQQIPQPLFAGPDEAYSKQLQDVLIHRIAVADELKSYQTLYHLDKINPFTVSEIYFDTVAERVKERIYDVNPDRISVWDTLLNLIFGKRTAWAFGLVFIMGLAFYFNRPEEIVEEPGDCKTLACLEKQEILNTDAMSNFDEEQLMDMVDVNALNKQLNLKEQKSDSLSVKGTILENTDTDELLDAL
jgi:hypothetical protein